MARYCIPTLDLSRRMSLALEMLTPFPERGWGRVTELAKQYHISRTLLPAAAGCTRSGTAPYVGCWKPSHLVTLAHSRSPRC